ncbi:MAG: amino acid adenylation domain-containing protein [Pedosphaera sp.]|nr:amino acid adenylation domain-containing protein [Pedosphaera sp.]
MPHESTTLPGPDATEATYPLSPLQQGMLFHHLSEPGSGVDIEQMVCTLREPLDVEKLRAAWERVVARHAILRTGFRWEGVVQPEQEVRSAVSVPLVLEDLRPFPAAAQQEKLSAFRKADRTRGFAMNEAPMLRLALFRCGDAHFELVWTFHHALLDGRSFPIVLNEVFAFYEALLRGEEINPPLPRPYRGYIEWLQQLDATKAEKFWRDLLKNFRATTPLVVDQKREVATGESRQGDQEVRLSSVNTGALQKLAAANNLTLNTLVQGAWALLLHRYSGEDDVVFGATRACRRSAVEGAENMVGLFINTLPVRAKIDPEEPLLPWLKRLREQWVAMRDFEHTPLVKVQAWSEVPPGMALFDSIVVFENFLLNTTLRAQGGAWTNREFRLYEQTNFPLTLAVYSGDELCLKMEFDRGRFDDATIMRMLGHLKTLLEGMAANPQAKLCDLPLLTSAERHELLVEWNKSHPSHPSPPTLHEWFESQAARRPDAIALSCERIHLSYRQLNERANQLAHLLRACGVGPDVIVGICIDRSLEMVIGILGILKAGGAYLPIDLSYPKDRLAFMLEDAQAPVLLTQKKLLTDLPAHNAKVICLDDPHQVALDSQPKTNPPNQTKPEHLAYVIFTSGSTGKPKGCCITHQNVVRLVHATDDWYHFNERDVWTLFHSYAFDFSVWEIWGALLYGGRLVVVPYLVSRSPEAFYELLADEKVTVLNQTPSAFRQLIHAEQNSPRELALRYVIFGGEALEMQSLKPWFDRHGDARPQLINMYGITETTVHVTYRPLTANDVQAASVIGIPIPDLQIYILDSRRQPVPIGVPGEMFVGGAGLARGYLNRPELTAERFIPNPFSNEPGARLYKTGDLARFLPGHDIEYLGRIDHQVKIRGFRIELGEIESVLCQHAAVREAVVLAREDGPGGKRLVAYLTAKNGAKPGVGELRDHLKVKVPEYMVPAAFVLLDRLPLTNNGKVDRKALPAPEVSRLDAGREFVAPRSEAEKTLAEIWKQVLRVERVGIHDNFFELGGDSILTIQIIARARQAGIALTPKQLFKTPMVAELAASAKPTVATVSEQGLVSGSAPLTPIQHWFFEQNLREPNHYNQAFLFSLSERLDGEALPAAVAKLIEHHDALRLRFTKTDSGWRQEFVAPGGLAPVERKDLSTLPPAEQGSAIERVSAEVQASLDITNGPLLRVAYFDLGADKPGRLLVVVHHLAVDGVSWRTLMEDLETAYGQLCAGKPVQLPPKTASFKQWSERLVEFAKCETLRNELDFWRAVCAGDAPKLPKDFPVTSNNTEASTSTITVALDAEETRALLQKVPAAYNTQINDVLLTALAQSFARWTGGRSLLVDLEGHGREEVGEPLDLSRTVGWFTSVFPVRLDISERGVHAASSAESVGASKRPEGRAPIEALKSVKEQLRRMPQRGIGYGALRYLAGDATLRSQPQPEVVFNYLGQFDQVLFGSKLFSFAPESSGPWHSLRNTRRHWLEINSLVVNGRLELRWTFSRNAHRAETIQRVANEFNAALREIISHCIAPGAGGFTPSDFPLAQLDQATLDRIAAATPDLEAICPLSPMQQLFYTLESAHAKIGFHQYYYALHGPLDAAAFCTAWERVVARHAILRTGFVGEGLKQPMQVIHRSGEVPWQMEDWRGVAAAGQEQKFSKFLHDDGVRGFDLAKPPLMRCALIRVADDQYRFVWCHHHLHVDGWSWPLIFKEVAQYYEGSFGKNETVLPPARPFSDYIGWLAHRDTGEDEQFWREALRGFKEPTPLPQTQSSSGSPRFAEESARIAVADVNALRDFARTNQLTFNTLAQAAWAAVLSRQSGNDDVVFGAAFSGRPAELAGVETMVGSFVNDLPVRVRVAADAKLGDWLAELQAAQTHLGLHQFTSPMQVQEWSEVPWRLRLF